MDTAPPKTADLLRRARTHAGLTQSELARRTGTTQSAIARLEAGATEPSLARVAMIVAACGSRLVIELDETAVALAEWPSREEIHARWEGAVRVANFILDGRRAAHLR